MPVATAALSVTLAARAAPPIPAAVVVPSDISELQPLSANVLRVSALPSIRADANRGVRMCGLPNLQQSEF
jgi:hypothetical protein